MPTLFCTSMGPLLIPPTDLGATPQISAPGPPGRPTPKKVFPQFFKNLTGGVQVFVCAIQGPPRPVRDKISATVPWPIFAEKNSEIMTEIDDFSRYLVIFTKLRISGRFHKFTALLFGNQTTHASDSCQFSSIYAQVL